MSAAWAQIKARIVSHPGRAAAGAFTAIVVVAGIGFLARERAFGRKPCAPGLPGGWAS